MTDRRTADASWPPRNASRTSSVINSAK